MTEHEGSGSEGLSEPVLEAFSKGYYEQMSHEAKWAEIDLDALAYNMRSRRDHDDRYAQGKRRRSVCSRDA